MKEKFINRNAVAFMLAAAMTAGFGSMPAFAAGEENALADTFLAAGEEEQQELYVLMNIPYAEFYKAEVNNSIEVDGFTSATKAKTMTGSLAGGSYHVNSDGSDITGITYPVKVTDVSMLEGLKQVTDSDKVDITVTNRGQTSTTTYEGQDALFQNETHAYYILSETPEFYKELVSVSENGFTFGTVVGEVTEVTDTAVELTTNTSYGDYQLSVSGIPATAGEDDVYAVVLYTKEGDSYGLRHMENVWRVSELSWCTGFTTAVHGCPTSSAHYEKIMGQTIDKITYYTSNGIFTLDTEVYVPVKIGGNGIGTTVNVSDTSVEATGTTVTVSEALPASFDAVYAVDGLDATYEAVTATGGTLIFSDIKPGSYTLSISDKNDLYVGLSADFVAATDKLPVVLGENASGAALIAAEGFGAEDLDGYVGNITSVTVSGQAFDASGRNSVPIVLENGTIDLDAVSDETPIFEDGLEYEIIVSSTGYPEYKFTLKADKSPKSETLLCDADLNGKIELKDATLVLRAALGIEKLEGQAAINSDSNEDGKIDLSDAVKTLKAALGIKE